MPGTICSPLEKLCAHRIPGLIERPSLAAVRPGPVTVSSRVHTSSSRTLKTGCANHTTLAPTLYAVVVARSPTAFLADDVTVAPAFQCVTSRSAMTTLTGKLAWTPSAPVPRAKLERPVGSNSESRGATDSPSAPAS